MPTNRITIQLVGSFEDEWHVTLSAFLTQLEAVKAALKQTERLVSGEEETSVYYRIVDLRHSSPATIVLEAVSRSSQPQVDIVKKKQARRLPHPDYSHATVHKFFDSLREIREKKRPARANLQTLEAYRNLAAPLDKKVSGLKIINSQESVDIDRQFRAAIDEIIGPDELLEGTIDGMLEKLNLHNTARFDIFPTVGPKQVACDFGAPLREEVVKAVDQYVRVSGSYATSGLRPYAVNAESVEVLPTEDSLPTLFDVRGIAPDLTSGQSAVDFLKGIRNG